MEGSRRSTEDAPRSGQLATSPRRRPKPGGSSSPNQKQLSSQGGRLNIGFLTEEHFILRPIISKDYTGPDRLKTTALSEEKLMPGITTRSKTQLSPRQDRPRRGTVTEENLQRDKITLPNACPGPGVAPLNEKELGPDTAWRAKKLSCPESKRSAVTTLNKEKLVGLTASTSKRQSYPEPGRLEKPSSNQKELGPVISSTAKKLSYPESERSAVTSLNKKRFVLGSKKQSYPEPERLKKSSSNDKEITPAKDAFLQGKKTSNYCDRSKAQKLQEENQISEAASQTCVEKKKLNLGGGVCQKQGLNVSFISEKTDESTEFSSRRLREQVISSIADSRRRRGSNQPGLLGEKGACVHDVDSMGTKKCRLFECNFPKVPRQQISHSASGSSNVKTSNSGELSKKLNDVERTMESLCSEEEESFGIASPKGSNKNNSAQTTSSLFQKSQDFGFGVCSPGAGEVVMPDSENSMHSLGWKGVANEERSEPKSRTGRESSTTFVSAIGRESSTTVFSATSSPREEVHHEDTTITEDNPQKSIDQELIYVSDQSSEDSVIFVEMIVANPLKSETKKNNRMDIDCTPDMLDSNQPAQHSQKSCELQSKTTEEALEDEFSDKEDFQGMNQSREVSQGEENLQDKAIEEAITQFAEILQCDLNVSPSPEEETLKEDNQTTTENVGKVLLSSDCPAPLESQEKPTARLGQTPTCSPNVQSAQKKGASQDGALLQIRMGAVSHRISDIANDVESSSARKRPRSDKDSVPNKENSVNPCLKKRKRGEEYVQENRESLTSSPSLLAAERSSHLSSRSKRPLPSDTNSSELNREESDKPNRAEPSWLPDLSQLQIDSRETLPFHTRSRQECISGTTLRGEEYVQENRESLTSPSSLLAAERFSDLSSRSKRPLPSDVNSSQLKRKKSDKPTGAEPSRLPDLSQLQIDSRESFLFHTRSRQECISGTTLRGEEYVQENRESLTSPSSLLAAERFSDLSSRSKRPLPSDVNSSQLKRKKSDKPTGAEPSRLPDLSQLQIDSRESLLFHTRSRQECISSTTLRGEEYVQENRESLTSPSSLLAAERSSHLSSRSNRPLPSDVNSSQLKRKKSDKPTGAEPSRLPDLSQLQIDSRETLLFHTRSRQECISGTTFHLQPGGVWVSTPFVSQVICIDLTPKIGTTEGFMDLLRGFCSYGCKSLTNFNSQLWKLDKTGNSQPHCRKCMKLERTNLTKIDFWFKAKVKQTTEENTIEVIFSGPYGAQFLGCTLKEYVNDEITRKHVHGRLRMLIEDRIPFDLTYVMIRLKGTQHFRAA